MNDLFLLGYAYHPITYIGLPQLFERDRDAGGEDILLGSGDLCYLDSDEIADLEDGTRALTVLAIDVVSGDVIGHVSMHRKTTFARGTSAHVELMVVDPRFRGRGISRPLLVSAIRRAARDWRTVRAVTLTSRPKRERARALYAALGFKPRSGDEFKLALGSYPWRPEDGEVGIDAVTTFTSQRRIDSVRPDALRLAVTRACKGGVLDDDPRLVLDPIALCRYKTRE